ncbi:MAG: HNH endonuclease [Terrimicrobiaceae bacterium]|nr:HNH endonuclease [Terrimicrobiaceae bacterium]
MATTPLQRMMFVQGQHCFFCNRSLPKSEASIEHLVPASAGGFDHPDNLVACCKTLNALFGNMNVKKKIRAILKQNGKFVCPNPPTQPPATARQPPPSTQTPK